MQIADNVAYPGVKQSPRYQQINGHIRIAEVYEWLGGWLPNTGELEAGN